MRAASRVIGTVLVLCGLGFLAILGYVSLTGEWRSRTAAWLSGTFFGIAANSMLWRKPALCCPGLFGRGVPRCGMAGAMVLVAVSNPIGRSDLGWSRVPKLIRAVLEPTGKIATASLLVVAVLFSWNQWSGQSLTGSGVLSP